MVPWPCAMTLGSLQQQLNIQPQPQPPPQPISVRRRSLDGLLLSLSRSLLTLHPSPRATSRPRGLVGPGINAMPAHSLRLLKSTYAIRSLELALALAGLEYIHCCPHPIRSGLDLSLGGGSGSVSHLYKVLVALHLHLQLPPSRSPSPS